ncbi:MAG: ESX secretion-associated protein EspG [Labedaea sp.]
MAAIGELSLPALDILWNDLALGGLPFPLEVRSHGDTVEERARLRGVVYEQLDRRGLMAAGRPAAGLAQTLRLLARPKISIDLVGLGALTDAQPLRAIVAARGKHAVLAVQRDLAVRLTPVRDTAIVESIVELLPHIRSGPGQSVSLPAARFSAQPATKIGRHRRTEGAERNGNGGVLRTATQSDHTTQLRFLDSVLERPILRAGSIGMMLRDESGKLQRLPGVGYFDTDRGRYVTSTARGSDGQDWTTLSPMDNPRLVHRLTETLVVGLRR